LLVDDQPAQRRLISTIVGRGGWQVTEAENGDQALALLTSPTGDKFDAVVLDSSMPGATGIDVLETIRPLRPALPIVMLTAQSTIAIEAMRAGASDYLCKPACPERLLETLGNLANARHGSAELRPLSEKIPGSLAFDEIVGSSPEFRAALAIAAKAARARVPLLIDGEPGVGKEVVAQAIHAASPRAKKPLIVVNCGAIPRDLAESVLFGHAKGAVTSTAGAHVGHFEDADGGTLFLDEVGELPLDTQVKLLHALQSGEIEPVGARRTVAVDVRVIAATNRTLADEATIGRLHEGLSHRLNAVHITIPPLRNRISDIPALARHLLLRIADQPGMRPKSLADDAVRLLMAYDWPGNVRQLQNALFRASVLCDGDTLTAQDFPHLSRIMAAMPAADGTAGDPLGQAGGVTLFDAAGHLRPLDEIEADIIRLAIGHYRGRMSEVARRLGIGRSTLYRKLGELGIEIAL